jgi:transcriptional regulator with XRE-family HTH domain
MEAVMKNLIGARVRMLRLKKGITLEGLANKIGSSKSYVWEIENKDKSISAIKLGAIAKVLDTTIDFLLGGVNIISQEDATDRAFFRKYSEMGAPAKKQLQKMLDILDDEDD